MLPDDNSSNGKNNASDDLFDEILGDLAANASNEEEDAFSGSPQKPSGQPGNGASSGQNAPGLESAKVELDIDDAPFLEEEEEEPEAEQPPPPPSLPPGQEDEEEPKGIKALLSKLTSSKKRMALAGGLGLAVLLAPLAFLFFSGGDKPAPEPPVDVTPPPAPSAPPAIPQQPERRYVFEGAPYLVERRGSEGEIRFLHVRFTLVTDNPALFAEMQQKSILLRDAVYHYLSNKPLTFLSDEEQFNMLRTDLISVINEHLTADKISELNFEEYLVTGR